MSSQISKKMRCDQIQALEVYFEMSKEDPTLIKFLETINRKIIEFLAQEENGSNNDTV